MIRRRRAPLASLLAAAFTFRVGNAIASVALPWLVLTRTGSASLAGVTAACGVVATILGSVIGGGLVDRWGPRTVATFSGAFGGLVVGLVPLLAAAGLLPTTVFLVLVAAGAAFDAPGMAAQDSRLPELGRLAGLSLERVTSLKALFTYSAILGGPAIGGAAVGLLGPAPTLWLTAACSIGSGLLALLALPRRRRAVRRAPAAERFQSAGLLHLRREPLLGPLLVTVMMFAGVSSATATVVVPALFVDAGRAAAELGTFSSAMGAGGLAGVSLYGALAKRLAPGRWLARAFATYGVVVVAISLLPPLPVLIGIGFVGGLMTGPTSPILNTTIYERTPAHLRGRVLGATSAMVMSAAPVMTIGAGALVDMIGPRFSLFVTSAFAVLIAGLALRLRFGRANGSGQPLVHPVSLERNA